MPLDPPLLLLPIHRRSCTRYYQDHKRNVEQKKKKQFAKGTDYSWEELSDKLRMSLEHDWCWPPWLVNDIIGFLVVTGNTTFLQGHVFLKRTFLPKDHFERSRKYKTTLQNQEMLYYTDHKEILKPDSIADRYVDAFQCLVNRTEQALPKKHETYRVWVPHGLVKNLNFDRYIRTLGSNTHKGET